MQAMILAAGLGTRLKPFTDHHPKALALVNGKSLLQRNIQYLQQFGINKVVVNVHHFADQVIEAVNENQGWGSTVVISDETREVLETGGGVLKAAHFFENESRCLVMNADILTDLNLHEMLQMDLETTDVYANKLIATLAVTHRNSSRNLLFNTQGRLGGWRNNLTGEERWGVKENQSEFTVAKAFSGIQIIHTSFFKEIKLNGKFSLIDAYLSLANEHMIYSYDHSDGILLDVGKPESIQKAENLFK